MLRPLTLSSVASRAVRNSTGVRVPPERSRLATSKPSRSGSITSSTTRSGRWRRTAEIASSPPVAVATSNPARRRLAERSSRMLGSSSTTSSRASGVVSLMAAILTAVAWRRLAVSWEVPGSGEWWPSTSTPPAPGGAHGQQRRHRRLGPVRPALQLQDGPADHLPAWPGGGRHHPEHRRGQRQGLLRDRRRQRQGPAPGREPRGHPGPLHGRRQGHRRGRGGPGPAPRPRRAPHDRQGAAAADRGAVLEPGRLPALPGQEDGAVRGRPGYAHTMTSRVRGPWTPSTRSSSMSLVALGPLIQVWGREGSRRATAWGTPATTWAAVTTTRW